MGRVLAVELSTHDPTVDAILASAALLTALYVIWRKGLRPIVRAAQRIGDIWDTLQEVATEFKPNHGSSMKDKIDAAVAVAHENGARVEAMAVDVADIKQKQIDDFELMQVHIQSDLQQFETIEERHVENRDRLDELGVGVRNLQQMGIANVEIGLDKGASEE